MNISHSKRIEPNRCPFCGIVHDAVTGVDKDKDAVPSPGDITVCVGCYEWAVFDENMTRRKPTDEEYDYIANDETLRHISERLDYIKQTLETQGNA